MPTLNRETGFYQGKTVERNGQTYLTECLPTAVANYLLLHGISKDAIENVLQGIIERPEYMGVGGGVSTFDIPEIVERALRTHIDEDIRVTLYSTIPKNKVPNEKKNRVKHIPKGTNISPPVIVLTEVERSFQHLWVVAGGPFVPERIDNDGKAHESLRPIGGYLEIKGL